VQKINLGLIGILIIITMIAMFFLYYKKQNQKTIDDLEIIQLMLDDLDKDFHDLKEKIE
tara:strand:+ start:1254 stop:1430 length:177 start_codon:yes stop_codon:yes gene_type:complete